MTLDITRCLLESGDRPHEISDYQVGVPRWCNGCGDNAILTAMQRLCRDNDLTPERTVFVSGIGCSSRLPHYMRTYGFHGLHGRALPIAEGVKMSRPDLTVFVSTGDGDCLSIGAAHWIHAIRYNMDLTVLLHDNRIYGLTKKQASPTSPLGTRSNTTPKGSYLEALNPLTVSLGVANVSFVAQVVDWIPDVLYQVLSAAYRHRGLSFVRIIQRCPEFMPGLFDPWMQDPLRTVILRHPDGVVPSADVGRIYRNQREHDPRDLAAAREIAASEDPIPVGILFSDPDVPRYEELRHAGELRTPDVIRAGLEAELDRFTIRSAEAAAGG
ncbi:MAG TPA: thiamine pyrophosphate-dependent enzyme [Candidatus Limnocylindria bacterium]|nr:thiamine pyrophosphate-dependent enzyme [Candidatus Limnocylindria bacterium]